MNFLTDKIGRNIDEWNPLPVSDVTVSRDRVAISAESVTFVTGAAGFSQIVSLDKAPIMNFAGDEVGSYWRTQKNLVLGNNGNPINLKVTALTETATAADITITSDNYNLEQLFETPSGSRQFILMVRDAQGDELYGWIDLVAATGSSYVVDIYNAYTSGAKSWKGTLGSFERVDNCTVEIYLYDTSFAWVTGTVLTQEIEYKDGINEVTQLDNMSSGDYAIDYELGRILYKKATTGTSDTANYTTRGSTSVVDSEFPTATAIADATANPTTTSVASMLMGFNGTTWDRIRSVETGKVLSASEYAEDTVFANASYLSLGGQEIDDPTALATMTEGDVGNFKGDLSGRQIVTLGTLSAGENLTDNLVQVAMRPVATATNTYSRDSSTALEASSISKASAGNLYRAFGVIDATAATDIYYIQFLDSATLTADGAVTHLITPVPVNHTTGTDSSFDTGHFDAGVAATAGIVIVASTTMVLKTIAGSVLFATVLYK